MVHAVRDGSMILQGHAPPRPASVGDVVMTAPEVSVGYAPEGGVTVTTLLIDTDYLIEHLFWQHLDLIPDRDAALTSRERASRVASPRWRAFRPVRREAAQAAALMRDDIAKRWRLSDLATHPPRHFRRYIGANLSEYRRYGPPSVSRERPGIAVARTAHAPAREP